MAANAVDLTKLQTVKDWLKLDVKDDDALLQRLITAASLYIEDWLSMPVKSASRTEIYDGTGTRDLVLRVFPVTAVTAVSIGGVAQLSTAWTSDDMGVHLVNDIFPMGRGNVSVTYVAGYTTVPFSLEQACIELVAHRYRERDRVGITTQAMGAGNTSFAQVDLPPQVATILRQYKRVTP